MKAFTKTNRFPSMIDKTHFRIPSTTKLDELSPTGQESSDSDPANERLSDVEKRLELFEAMLFDCAMTLKDKVADRLDQLEDLCHHENAQLRQEWQQGDHDRKKELNHLTLKISEAIDRIAAEKNREPKPTQEIDTRLSDLNGLPPVHRQNEN